MATTRGRSRAPRVEEIDALLDSEIESPQAILETLVNAAAKGQHFPALFEKLHAVTGAQDKVADLAFAYESLAQDRRMKLLSPELQAAVFLHATAFFADVFGDPDGAVVYAERVLATIPAHPEAVGRLERIFETLGDRARLAKLYFDQSGHEKDPANQLTRLRQAAEIAAESPELSDLRVDALTKIVRLDPQDTTARDDLEGALLEQGKPRDAAKVLEAALLRDPPLPDEEAFRIRTRLLQLFARDLGEPHRAVPHLEGLLAAAPGHVFAREVAESLLDNRAVAARAAAALSDAYEKLGLVDQAASMLSMELKVVRGPRRLEVQRRLAIIRHDQGDPTGALELLGPVVSADPGDDNARGRFVELSLSLNQPGEAARLLTRALSACKDPIVRARVNADVGTVYLRSGDNKRAEAALRQVIEDGQDAAAMLNAARELSTLYEKAGDQRALASALEVISKHETDNDARHAAARRLARLAEGELADPARAAVAWRALVESPWADEALRKLNALHEEAGDWEGLVNVTERRAARAKDVVEATALAYEAARLRTHKTRDKAAALGAWRALIARFGPSRDAFAEMIPLLEQEKQWKELAWVLEHDLELSPVDEWVATLNRLAQLRLSRLEDPTGALSAWQKALDTDPADKPSRAAVEKLLNAGELRLSAADILERVYRDEEPGTGLLRVLETRAELMPEPSTRLAALEEAIGLAGGALRDPLRALELAGQGLEHALVHDRSQLLKWIERVRTHGAEAGKPELYARALTHALGDQPIESAELLALARAAGDALVQSSQVQPAIEVFRRALEFDPSSSELLNRIDELLAEQGSPDERLALYRSALERNPQPARRRELVHAIARLQQNELSDPRSAVQTWRSAVADDERDPVAHEALVEVYKAARDWRALYAELERALGLHEGERRNATLLRMADTSAESGDVARALGHYRELLASAELGDTVLENIELLAHANNDAEMMRTVLERRIAVASAPEDRGALWKNSAWCRPSSWPIRMPRPNPGCLQVACSTRRETTIAPSACTNASSAWHRTRVTPPAV